MRNPETLLVSFLEEADHVITENAKAGIRNAWNDILKNQVEKYKLSMKINFSQLIDVLNLAEEITETIAIPTLEKLRKDGLMFTPTKIMILDCSEIKSINPSYLRKYVDELTSLVARSISNDTTALKMVKELTDGTFNAEHKRRMVDAKFSPYMKSKDMFNQDFIPIQFDAATIHSFYIPFLENYINEKAVPNNKKLGFRKLATEIVDVKKRMDKEVSALIATIEETGSIQGGTSARVCYAVITSYNEVFKYLVASTMRYICNYARDVRVIGDLVSQIAAPVSDKALDAIEAKMESADDEYEINITQEKLEDIATKMISDYKASGVEPSDEYANRVFDLPMKAMEYYSIKLLKFSNHVIQKPMLSIPEIAQECELMNEKFWSVLEEGVLVDDSFLNAVNYDPSYVLEDLTMIKLSLSRFPKRIRELISEISKIKVNLEMNKTDLIGDEDRIINAIRCLNDIEKRLNSSIPKVLKAFAERMNMIECHKNELCSELNEVIRDDSSSFFGDIYRLNYEILEESADSEINELNESYQKEYQKKICGAFFEAEDNNQNNQTTDNNANQKDNQGNNNSGQSNNTKPQVQDNDTPQQDNTNQNNQNGKNENSGGSITQKLRDAINKVVASIREFIQGKGAVNLKSLNSHRNYLMTRSYTNISVDVIPYQKRNYGDMLKKFIDASLQISDENLKSMSQDQIANTIFGSVSYASAKAGEDKGDPISSKLENAIAVGTAPKVTKKYVNNEVKVLVNDMIGFVESYYGENGIATTLEKLGKDGLSKLDSLDNKKSSGDGDKTTENVTTIKSCLTKSILATKNVCRNRCNEYMNVLQQIWANDPAGKNKNENNQATNNNGTAPAPNNNGNQQQNQQTNGAV